MAFSSTEEFGKSGVSQATLMEYLIHLQGVVDGIAAKLDDDGGVTDTDYQAKVQASLPALAIKNCSTTVATISSAVEA